MSEETILCITVYWFITFIIAMIAAVYEIYPKGRDVTWGQLLLLVILWPGYLTIGVFFLSVAILVTAWDLLDKPIRGRRSSEFNRFDNVD